MVTHTIPLDAASKADIQEMRDDPKRYFTERGAIFYGDADCSFEADGSTLVVKNTVDQLDLVQAILEDLVRSKGSKKSHSNKH